LITLIMAFYLFYYRPLIFAKNKMLLLITSVFIFQFLTVILVQDVLHWNYLSIPVTLLPMLISMLLDASVAFMGTVVLSLILGAVGGNNFYLALMTFVVGTIALYSVQKIRNRGQMFRAIFYILLGYAAINFSYGFIHYESFDKMLQNFAYYQIPNAILVPTAVFLLIGVFEKFFDVTTDITLLELSDLNHPLLKRLSVEAPGTFHHSIIVGNLAEAAAKEIGANSLLARVGCYYHDIGKMVKPEYFIENQMGIRNPHTKLTPRLSCIILVSHVKEGVEIARRAKLPNEMIRIIREHHGTSLIVPFFEKAKKQKKDENLNESQYRYPGPLPSTKESGIVMLADSVEAASRSLEEPNAKKLKSLINEILEVRFSEGQLNNSQLTLVDLKKIGESFLPILVGMHHLRVEYPKK
ncbi:HDIG domain-containing protein, partial [bacterium]|nr:HDIG domain-containing protein [bacterium]